MSSVNILSGVSGDYITKSITDNKTTKTQDTGTFDELYQAAVNLISGTNGYIQQAQQAEIDYAMGKLTSTHELSIIEEKANIALQYTVAIKNGILDAYKEIMQMQI
ncbi:flagellar hook-basal body complex protein FliE [Firmicutes bacterium CAG:882]|jgi:flagellar hook-basal body complex protein FliE|nr:flagellar hook-basal body complex protein FliE [Firmicutes bacterium CAG:882]